MIGVITETTHGAVFQQQGYIGEQATRFLAGYHEAAGLVGLGVKVLPVILTGQWPFPGTGTPGNEKRCLVGLGDGSGNDGIYDSVLRFYPALTRDADEVVISFIPSDSIQASSKGEILDIGRLSACFDLAAWFVDALPDRASRGAHDLTKWEVKALSLGVWVNILITWLYGMDVISHRTLEKMRLAICGIVMEKLALLAASRRPCVRACSTSPLSVQCLVETYIELYPGMMGRISAMLTCCSEDYILQSSTSPEELCHTILARSLHFFQSG